MSHVRSILPLVVCVSFMGLSCSHKRTDPNRVDTVPVKGLVLVDGQPIADVTVDIHNVADAGAKQVTKPFAKTKGDGKFEFSTYEAGDGVPPGEYVATFNAKKFSMISHSYVGPDKLNNRYSDPKKSQVRIKVEKGKPVDLGKIELTTK
jgi:5-hydroxyisourate hydrolase-like protein (transthyretin family)